MSGWKKAPSIDDDCECVNVSSVSDVDISVIRSADGKTCKVRFRCVGVGIIAKFEVINGMDSMRSSCSS